MLPLLATGVLYAPLWDRGFTSEDFLLIRFLRERPPWHDLQNLLTGPWLGIDVVRFYRPISQTLLAVEAQLFAGQATPYNLLHLGLHGINVLLVFDLASTMARSAGRQPTVLAPVAALLFALHPLHPNAVAWIASYATLFATTGVLAAALAWEVWRCRGGVGILGASVLGYLLALGCYEAAWVLPAAFGLGVLVRPVGGPGGRRRDLALLAHLAVATLYLLFRRSLFGEAVGGYGAFAERLELRRWADLAADAGTSLYRIFQPVYAKAVPPWAGGAVLLACLLGVVLVSRLACRRSRVHAQVGQWIFAWGWMVLFLAPFAFEPFVPANGRFAYLASVGAALALAQLIDLAGFGPSSAADVQGGDGGPFGAEHEAGSTPSPVTNLGWPGGRVVERGVRGLVLAAVVFLVAPWIGELRENVVSMDRAAEMARRVADSLASTELEGRPIFVADHPRFLFAEAPAPRAQVLRYGLSDSLGSPFRRSELAVFPLPEGSADSHAAAVSALAASLPEAEFLGWRSEAGDFAPLSAAPAPPILQAEVTDGRVVVPELDGAARYRLVVLTRGNPTVVELDVAPGGIGPIPFPVQFVRSMRHLYGDNAWWWIEEWDPRGEVRAVSPARAWPARGGSGRPAGSARSRAG